MKYPLFYEHATAFGRMTLQSEIANFLRISVFQHHMFDLAEVAWFKLSQFAYELFKCWSNWIFDSRINGLRYIFTQIFQQPLLKISCTKKVKVEFNFSLFKRIKVQYIPNLCLFMKSWVFFVWIDGIPNQAFGGQMS